MSSPVNRQACLPCLSEPLLPRFWQPWTARPWFRGLVCVSPRRTQISVVSDGTSILQSPFVTGLGESLRTLGGEGCFLRFRVPGISDAVKLGKSPDLPNTNSSREKLGFRVFGNLGEEWSSYWNVAYRWLTDLKWNVSKWQCLPSALPWSTPVSSCPAGCGGGDLRQPSWPAAALALKCAHLDCRLCPLWI